MKMQWTLLEQCQQGIAAIIGMDGSIGYDQILVGGVGRTDQAINPALKLELLMTFEVVH